jgi:hypothetical protein
LNHDPDVASWSGYLESNVQVDNQDVPMLIGPFDPTVSPPILSGHGLDGKREIVLGAATMAALGEHVGGTVVVSYGDPADAPVYVPPTKLTIVGTATFPAIGYASFIADHTSMGTGAMLASSVIPPAFQAVLHTRDPNLNGPGVVLVRFRPGVNAAAGRANLQVIADAADKTFAADPNAVGDIVSVVGVQRPAQIVNYHTMGMTPTLLAVALAAGAVMALGLALGASVRRRRRDLAVLKTLGFTHRQLASAVATQATVDAVVGIVFGIPLGVALGRELWTLFARNINAVPDPTVPVFGVCIVALATIAFANIIAVPECGTDVDSARTARGVGAARWTTMVYGDTSLRWSCSELTTLRSWDGVRCVALRGAISRSAVSARRCPPRATLVHRVPQLRGSCGPRKRGAAWGLWCGHTAFGLGSDSVWNRQQLGLWRLYCRPFEPATKSRRAVASTGQGRKQRPDGLRR